MFSYSEELTGPGHTTSELAEYPAEAAHGRPARVRHPEL